MQAVLCTIFVYFLICCATVCPFSGNRKTVSDYWRRGRRPRVRSSGMFANFGGLQHDFQVHVTISVCCGLCFVFPAVRVRRSGCSGKSGVFVV